MNNRVKYFVACLFFFNVMSHAETKGDYFVSGYVPTHFVSSATKNYTLLDKNTYQKTVKDAQQRIDSLIVKLKPLNKNLDQKIALIYRQLSEVPYIHFSAMGEGDWQADSMSYVPGATHIQQDPVYRLDGLNCQTYTQVALALLHATTRAEFERNLISLAYGAAGENLGIHYFNRNHFIEADFNKINQKLGRLRDVTTSHDLAKTINADITRQNWFLFQTRNLANVVHVLNQETGPIMAQRFVNDYTKLPYPNFELEKIKMSYLPKNVLAIPKGFQPEARRTRRGAAEHTNQYDRRESPVQQSLRLKDDGYIQQHNGTYQDNTALLNTIQTPAIVEIIRDPNQWYLNGQKIKDALGTEIVVSHLGLLYHQTFKQGAIIYQKITCHYDSNQQKICQVNPVRCEEKQCKKLMFSHATNAFPDNYYWYQDKNTDTYQCTASKPSQGKYTFCNRIVSLPLFDYLTDFQYGEYHYMNSSSILGIHIETIL